MYLGWWVNERRECWGAGSTDGIHPMDERGVLRIALGGRPFVFLSLCVCVCVCVCNVPDAMNCWREPEKLSGVTSLGAKFEPVPSPAAAHTIVVCLRGRNSSGQTIYCFLSLCFFFQLHKRKNGNNIYGILEMYVCERGKKYGRSSYGQATCSQLLFSFPRTGKNKYIM